ncbi:hypothetical protein PENTCL1PPCAC_21450, partial [Pristionchus entomophagus]
KVLQRVNTGTVHTEELRSFADYAAGWKKMVGASNQVCTTKIIGSILLLSSTDNGMFLIQMFAQKQSLRPLLIYPIASILHRLGETNGKQVLTAMLSNQTCHFFIRSCLEGEESSSFAKMFHSDIDNDECASIGMSLLDRADGRDRARIRAFLSRHGRSIAETEKGRAFI